jgi:hypothetical protein
VISFHPLRATTAALTLFALCAGLAGAQSAPLTKKGAEIDTKTTTEISSKTSHTGDTFELPVTDTLFHHRPELKGAAIEGHLENVVAASPTHKAAMNIIFDDIKFPSGSTEPISVALKNVSDFEPKTHHIRDVGIIIGSAVAGHIASKKLGHGGGTILGAGAGFAIVSGLKSDIVIKRGTLVRLRLLADLPTPA